MQDEDKNRKLRPQERRVYCDSALEDDEIEGGKRTYDVMEKLASGNYKFNNLINEMEGQEVTLDYFQEKGFTTPILVKDKTGLGLRVPSENFSPEDVKRCIGSRRVIDVMDVNTQTALTMTMKEFVKYFTERENRGDRLLNVLSLEFSHSRLDTYVEQPEVVKSLDWVNTVWPQYYKSLQQETTNLLDKMKYPKVQRYCLMSVGGCYTDFHIDMGGTSVWYHILHGQKVFWLIPPTPRNLELYTEWTLSGNQQDIFLGDKVDECQRITLQQGWTFFIPTGWIHAVYTPKDSLVFGGNFLHSLSMTGQLKVWEIENRTHVPLKFRYPFFTEMHWYLVERYTELVTGKSFRAKQEEEEKNEEKGSLSSVEITGLAEIVSFLMSLAPTKRSVPRDITDPDLLLKECQIMLESQDPSLASSVFLAVSSAKKGPRAPSRMQKARPIQQGNRGAAGKDYRKQCRRVRCKACEPCTRDDCSLCHYCKDMRKFGGPGVMKQCCLSRQCLAPRLPKSAKCQVCEAEGGDGLKECITCFQLTHPACCKNAEQAIDNEDLPSSWECPICVNIREPNEQLQQGIKRSYSPTTVKDEPAVKIPVFQYVVRPSPLPPPPSTVMTKRGPHPLPRDAWLKIMTFLPPHDMAGLLQVCRTFYVWGMSPQLWRSMDLSDRKITKTILIGTVRRQPRVLSFAGSSFSSRQLEWLIPRLPYLSVLRLSRVQWVGGLRLPPGLRNLDLAWTSGLNDSELADIISEGGARLRQLNLAGSDITDVSLDLITCHCPALTYLSLSGCLLISDLGIQALSSLTELYELDLTHCQHLTPKALPHLTNNHQGTAPDHRLLVHLEGALNAADIEDYCSGNQLKQEGGSIYF